MVSDRASKLHFSSLIVDTHSDSLGRAVDDGDDLGAETGKGHMDLPRMRRGNMMAQFFACYAAPEHIPGGKAIQRTLQFVDAMNRLCAGYPDDIELARTAADVRRVTGKDKIAGILCVEGGHSIEDDLAVLRVYHDLGVRYMTLTWNNTNNWADGVLDDPRHDGLTDFGREVVLEMNRLGIMVDISHVAPKTFWDAVETTTRPVIASHSSAKAICKAPRNMDDDQLRAVARNGGVADVNFESTFVSERYRLEAVELDKLKEHETEEAEARLSGDDVAMKKARDEIVARYKEQRRTQLTLPDWTEIVDHIDHMVGVAGVDHVGLGSDFDGSTPPAGMDDCTQLPKITEELVRRGYSDSDVKKILGENVMRVMKEVIGE